MHNLFTSTTNPSVRYLPHPVISESSSSEVPVCDGRHGTERMYQTTVMGTALLSGREHPMVRCRSWVYAALMVGLITPGLTVLGIEQLADAPNKYATVPVSPFDVTHQENSSEGISLDGGELVDWDAMLSSLMVQAERRTANVSLVYAGPSKFMPIGDE